ncbi:MAG: polysaccharide biosynthesis protein [Neisseriaceae bacterium]|nr:polysaccharide biosynthesis protein [Neisseriaceae bacterium]
MLYHYLNILFNLSRTGKKWLLLAHDIIMVSLAFWLAFLVRLDWRLTIEIPYITYIYPIVLIPFLIVFIKLGLYRSVLRYSGIKMIHTIIIGAAISVGMLLIGFLLFHSPLPRSIPILYFLILLFLLIGSRFTVKGLFERQQAQSGTPVLIYGAGHSGGLLLEALQKSHEYKPIAFIDDNPKLHKSLINGKKIYAAEKLPQLVEDFNIQKILLAIPHATVTQKQNIFQRLEDLPCEVLSVPDMNAWIDGTISTGSLKKVSITDLLGRETVAPDLNLMYQNIAQKNVLITGAGGSIGSELCRKIFSGSPNLIILFELNEYALYRIHHELEQKNANPNNAIKILPILGSVQDESHLFEIMKTFQIDTVYHAAAYKHVPMVALNTVAGVENNVFGTLSCANAAIKAQVTTFVLISTDKAVRPTNTMGASKRMAELILQALSQNATHSTRFCMVRFGNVLGSSGSVIPLFEQQIAAGEAVTITHPEITRFFMTIPEAAELVLQAGAMGQGGDVFVLDMGEPVKIMDLARKMIKLSGKNIKNDTGKDNDIEIKITGLRPGEKLYEEVLIGDNVQGTAHPRIMTANEKMLSWNELQRLLTELKHACNERNAEQIRHILLTAPTDFQPKDEISDLLYQQQKTMKDAS